MGDRLVFESFVKKYLVIFELLNQLRCFVD